MNKKETELTEKAESFDYYSSDGEYFCYDFSGAIDGAISSSEISESVVKIYGGMNKGYSIKDLLPTGNWCSLMGDVAYDLEGENAEPFDMTQKEEESFEKHMIQAAEEWQKVNDFQLGFDGIKDIATIKINILPDGDYEVIEIE